MTDFRNNLVQRTNLTRLDIAREEFWFVAKAFFAPVYGAILVLRHLMRETEVVDREASPPADRDTFAIPAE